mmetsp:Transcript_18279/g.37706  ORF Transcript_18279/g.37706 Transcript_18279/m.37706 type:complete len:232 (-) Transcript_18279:152-847(-)
MIYGCSKVSSLYRPNHVLEIHGRHFVVIGRFHAVSPIPHIFFQHVPKGSVLDRPHPFLRRESNRLLIKGCNIDRQSTIVDPFGKERRKVSISDGPHPFHGQNRGDTGIGRNIGDSHKAMHNSRDHIHTNQHIGEFGCRLHWNKLGAFDINLLSEVGHNVGNDIDVVADRVVGKGGIEAVLLHHQDVIQIGLGFFEAAGLRAIGARRGAAHQKGVVVLRPHGSHLQGGSGRG